MFKPKIWEVSESIRCIYCLLSNLGDLGPYSVITHIHICIANHMNIHIKWDNYNLNSLLLAHSCFALK